MAEVASLLVSIGSDVSGFKQGINSVESGMEKAGKSSQSLGSRLKSLATGPIGMAATAAGAAAAALGVTAVNAAQKFEKQMADVATLLDGNVNQRINEMGDQVKQLAMETGTSTEDMTRGLYQIVSAFGDTADSTEILATATRAAAAGGADVASSVDLLSAVTKGYGDTSAEAATQAADLAFQTVKLGQTTFPELANTMGRVIPLASTMKVSQEELFGAMATLTGVTGNTAEVTTQLRAAFQAIAKPSTEMQAALSGTVRELVAQDAISGEQVETWKEYEAQAQNIVGQMRALSDAGEKDTNQYKELQKALDSVQDTQAGVAAGMGQSIIESKGLQETLTLLTDSAQGNTNQMGKMFGSVEGLNAVLALTGTQADNFTQKTQAMTEAAGASENAFEKQSQTFSVLSDRFRQGVQVVLIEIGERMLPVLNKMLGWIVDNMPTIQETVSRAFEGIETVIGFISNNVIPPVITAFQNMSSIFGGVSNDLGGNISNISESFQRFQDAIMRYLDALVAFWQENFLDMGQTLQDLEPFFIAMQEIATQVFDVLKNTAGILLEVLSRVFNGIAQALDPLGETLKDFRDIAVAILNTIGALLTGDFSKAWESAQSIVDETISAVKNILNTFYQFFSGFFGTSGSILTDLENAGSFIYDTLYSAFTDIKNSVVEIVTNLGNSISDIFTSKLNSVKDTIVGWKENVVGAFSGLFQSLVGGSIVVDMVNQIGSEFNRMNTETEETTQSMTSQVLNRFSEFGTNFEGNIYGMVESGLNLFQDLKRDSVGTIENMAISALTAFTPLPRGLSRSLVEMGTNLIQEMLDINVDWKGAWNTLKEGAISIFRSIGDGLNRVKDTILAPIRWIQDKLSGVMGGIKNILGFGSPDLLTRTFISIGEAAQNMSGKIDRAMSRTGRAMGVGLAGTPAYQAAGVGQSNLTNQNSSGGAAGSFAGLGDIQIQQNISGGNPQDVARETRRALRQVASNWRVEDGRLL